MADSPIPLRPHVVAGSDVYKLICKRSCWHFDAWFYMATAEVNGFAWALYLVCEGRAGGMTMIRRDVFKVYADGELKPTDYMPDDARPVTMNDRALPANVRELMQTVHTGFVQEFAHMKPPEGGYKGVSVALHYVRAPDVDVLEGIAA